MEDLEGYLAAQMRVLGRVHVGHPARADALEDAVATVHQRVVGDFRHPPACFPRSTCNTCLAMGAATVPPCPWVFSTVTAIAAFGLSTGAKAMNHGWVNSRLGPTSAVPVLPATWMPLSAPAVPDPSFTTLVIITASLSEASFDITRENRSGSIRCLILPSLRSMRSVRWGRMSLPSLATADATIAIWKGVTWSRSWPIATRPMSTAAVGSISRPLSNIPLGVICSAG